MARDRDAAGAESYPAEDDVTGAGRHPDDRRGAGERLPDEPVRGESVHRPEGGAGLLGGEAGTGREGLTGDDRTPRDGAEAHPGTAAARTTSAAGIGRAGTGTTGTGTPGRDTARAGTPGTSTPGTGAAEGAGVTGRRESGTGPRGEGEFGASVAGDRMTGDRHAAPAPGGVTAAEAASTEGRAADTGRSGPAAARTGGTGRAGTEGKDSGSHAPLLAHEEAEKWEAQLRQTLAGFVEEPRSAVEEADRTLEEIAARFGEAVTRRRRTLRMSWQKGEEDGPGHQTDTEQLRLALRDYRELADRLLHL
ncbi:hypothetical protein ABZ467_00445 [Streptomyces sp. NPDC005727]|uniref:hypothetical protein n=1 Tax=Streptomyces sp. NPDC005727 TaxID=3157053 RepID=UPI0033C0F455